MLPPAATPTSGSIPTHGQSGISTTCADVNINDGVVMACDSAATLQSGQTYLNADKMVNLIRGKPIAAMMTGDGGIGRESISTLFKDLRAQLTAAVDANNYTVEQVVRVVRDFFRDKLPPGGPSVSGMLIRICGYSTERPLPEIWQLVLLGQECHEPTLCQDEQAFGLQCNGQSEAVERLVLGYSPRIGMITEKLGMTPERWQEVQAIVSAETFEHFVAAAMPIQDAIDLARFLVETTAGFVQFSLREQPKTVGGPVEIAAITKHEGFRWIQRKHFYPGSLNPALG
ncbi:MAG: hypothetical protein AB7F35_01215 [Acetobacteraceae bacterium]